MTLRSTVVTLATALGAACSGAKPVGGKIPTTAATGATSATVRTGGETHVQLRVNCGSICRTISRACRQACRPQAWSPNMGEIERACESDCDFNEYVCEGDCTGR